jgi:phosphoglycolate phosphatase/riboflavin kinase
VKANITVTGKIVSGMKKGNFFTNLEWVQDQCQKRLGFKPYPGTLNLDIGSDPIGIFEQLRKTGGIRLVSPDPDFCSGHVYPVSVMGVSGAVVVPAEDVRAHGNHVLEVIAPVNLKEALDVADGDEIMLTFKADSEASPAGRPLADE